MLPSGSAPRAIVLPCRSRSARRTTNHVPDSCSSTTNGTPACVRTVRKRADSASVFHFRKYHGNWASRTWWAALGNSRCFGIAERDSPGFVQRVGGRCEIQRLNERRVEDPILELDASLRGSFLFVRPTRAIRCGLGWRDACGSTRRDNTDRQLDRVVRPRATVYLQHACSTPESNTTVSVSTSLQGALSPRGVPPGGQGRGAVRRVVVCPKLARVKWDPSVT